MKCPRCLWPNPANVTAEWLVAAAINPMGQNVLGSNSKANHRYRKYRALLVNNLQQQLNAIPRATRHRCVLVTREYTHPQRRYDHGNFVGGCKPLMDVLQSFGVIVNDSDQYLSAWYHQTKAKTGNRLLLLVQEVDL